ncbi:hypothetical protein Val02_82410 [Virgisporangium aliadipatigenens]|uniref:Uncharacterized protein n=1 Tax=Virgisporangium aliadipatigenens TaxID=741659 RepID=A0A8J4DUI7_9ACTN|nr:hypothetical protein Val02_82410 [Virgisporangium aliadipatigenens]
MTGWRQRFFLRRTLSHPDGREIVVYEDTGQGVWIVEARPTDRSAHRTRWTAGSESGAVRCVAWLCRGDPQWREGRDGLWGQGRRRP